MRRPRLAVCARTSWRGVAQPRRAEFRTRLTVMRQKSSMASVALVRCKNFDFCTAGKPKALCLDFSAEAEPHPGLPRNARKCMTAAPAAEILSMQRRWQMNRLAQCHCGSLRARISGDPLMVSLCHCRDCQRRTGTLAGSGAIFEKSEVAIEGDRKVFERDGQEGRKVRFHFCPSCGTSLYWDGDFRPGWCVIAVGAFADPTFPPPSVSVFEESKHAWLQLPDGMKHAQRGLVSSAAKVVGEPRDD
jgi:hypothetical protein